MVITADADNSCQFGHTVSLKDYTVSPLEYVAIDAPCVVIVNGEAKVVSSSPTSTSQPPNSSSAASDAAVTEKSNNKGGLSTGAKAAIGVCIPLFVIFMALAIFALLRRRSRRAAAAPDNAENSAAANPDAAYGWAGKAEVDGTEQKHMSPRSGSVGLDRSSELYGSPPPAARLHQDVIELPAESHIPEMSEPRPAER